MQAQQSSFQDNPLAGDFDHIFTHTESVWEDLRGKRIFITGGTGFLGCWLLESFAWANENLGLNASILVLTRDYDTFQKKSPHLAVNPAIQFHIGDVRNFDFPEGEFSHIIHAAATSARATFNNEDFLVKFDTIVEGTRHTLDFAVRCHARKFLLTSSGAVYGKQPSGMTHVSEDYCGAPDPADLNSAWGEAKRAAEFFCAYYSKTYGIETKIARGFSFVGPYLPLDIHYAIGNFILDALNGGPIIIKGDGTSYRSYLYSADMATWLWTILIKGKFGEAYNVGSDKEITIKDLAYVVSDCFKNKPGVIIKKKREVAVKPDRYVPGVDKSKAHLGLDVQVDLTAAIKRTIGFHSKSNYMAKRVK